MKKIQLFALIVTVFFMSLPAMAGERTIPVDMFLMIDKSLSMAEPGKFDSLQKWVQEHLLGQILINGDWITIYQFYGQADQLLTLQVSSEEDKKKITATIGKIKPDGQYTDIGLALDTLKGALEKRGTNDRLKIMLLLTDLRQEAPWTSRYAGSQDTFESPYLAEARQIPHDNWFEITLDMDIQDAVVKTSKELYYSIQELDTNGTGRVLPADEGELLAGTVTASGSGPAGETSGGAIDSKTGKKTRNATGTAAAVAVPGTLPFLPLVVVVSVILIACLAAGLLVIRDRRKKKEQSE